MEPPEERSMSLEIIEVRADDRTRPDPILDWLPRRGWWLGPTVVGVALLIGFVMGFLVRGLSIPAAEVTVAAPPPAASPEVAPPPVVETVKTEPATPPEETAPSPPNNPRRPRAIASEAARSEAPAEDDGPMVELELSSEPSEAWVIQDGITYGKTPLTVPVPAQKVATFLLKKDGHRPERIRWKPGASTTLSTTLTAEVSP